MGRKVEGCCAPFFWGGGSGSPFNTMWSGPRPTSIRSGILSIQPFGHNINVTDRQDRTGQDRQTTVRQGRANRFTNDRPKMTFAGYLLRNNRGHKCTGNTVEEKSVVKRLKVEIGWMTKSNEQVWIDVRR